MKITLLSATTNPQKTCAIAARVCYSEYDAMKDLGNLSEQESANWLIDACLTKKHFSPLEHASFSVQVQDAYHAMVMQLRTHRVGVQFQVQSMRYTSKRFLDESIKTEDLFHFRKEDKTYYDRKGNSYKSDKNTKLLMCETTRQNYIDLIRSGVAEEEARDVLGSGYLQNFVMTCNLRSFFHLVAMRSPSNAQIECQEFIAECYSTLLSNEWASELLNWHKNKYDGKSFLSF
jgi:thymidylate synthase (FAD)